DEALDHDPEEDPGADADQHGHRPGQPPGDVGVVDDEGADDQELALGEVDDLGGLVDQDEAEGGQGQDGAVGEAIDGEEDEPAHTWLPNSERRTPVCFGVKVSMLTIWRVMSRVAVVPSW